MEVIRSEEGTCVRYKTDGLGGAPARPRTPPASAFGDTDGYVSDRPSDPSDLTSDLPSLESKWGDFQDTDQQDLATARGRKTQPLATGQKYGDKASLMRT